MGTPGQAKNSQRKQEAQERRAHIMQLRASGMQPSAIAELLKLSLRSVTRHISRALADAVSSATEDYRALEATRLDALIHAYWDKATGGDLQSAYFVSKIIGQRMALFGLVQPPAKEDDLGDALLATLQRVQTRYKAMQQNLKEAAEQDERESGIRREYVGVDIGRVVGVPAQQSEARQMITDEARAPSRPAWARALAIANGSYSEQDGDMPPND